MSEYRIATRYAKSLLELAHERGELEKVHADMQLFQEVCDQNRNFRMMLRNPVVTNDKKYNILKKIFEKKVHKLTMAIFKIITDKNREAYIPDIAREFHNQYNELKGIKVANITTPIALTDDIKKEIHKLVKKMLDKEVELKEEIDEDLVGGFVLKVGDRRLDESISGKLKKLKLDFETKQFFDAKD